MKQWRFYSVWTKGVRYTKTEKKHNLVIYSRIGSDVCRTQPPHVSLPHTFFTSLMSGMHLGAPQYPTVRNASFLHLLCSYAARITCGALHLLSPKGYRR